MNSNGARELVWRRSDGVEKRMVLPIEIIQEDLMEDTDHILKTVESNFEIKDDEDREKILSVVHELKQNFKNESSKQSALSNVPSADVLNQSELKDHSESKQSDLLKVNEEA